MILLLYVDDLFVTGEDGLIVDMKRKLAAEFKMKDLGMMHYFLGMEMWQNADGISLGAMDIYGRDPEEIQDDGLEGHDQTYGIKPKAIEWCFIIFS